MSKGKAATCLGVVIFIIMAWMVLYLSRDDKDKNDLGCVSINTLFAGLLIPAFFFNFLFWYDYDREMQREADRSA